MNQPDKRSQPDKQFSKHAFQESTRQSSSQPSSQSSADAQQDDRRVKVTLTRSPIGLESSQRRTCEALGLKRINRSRVHDNTPAIRGMLHKVRHLVSVEMVAPSSANASGDTEETARADS